MTSYEAVELAAAQHGLLPLGGVQTDAGTLVLLGPQPDAFWPILQASPEAGESNPVDAWSTRVITHLAETLGAAPRFPFGSPPQPFITWALASGTCHLSPVGLLVHETQGLNVSFRGALQFAHDIALPAAAPRPCDTCDAPCLTACPVEALGSQSYDLDACHRWLDPQENTCMAQGCAARRACPLSPPRPDAQAAHHMRYFHRPTP